MAIYGWFFDSRLADYAFSSVTVGGAAIIFALYFFQTKLIYLPDFPPGSRKEVWRPSRFGMDKFEEVYLTAADGVKLHCFWIPSLGGKSVPTVLFLHVMIYLIIFSKNRHVGKCGEHGS